MSDAVSVPRAARLVGRHPATVRRWVREGVLPAIRTTRGLRVPLAALAGLARSVGSDSGRKHERLRTRSDTDELPHGYDALAEDEGASETDEPMAIDLSSYLSLREAADRVRRSTRTVRRWVAAGELPRAVVLKGRLLIPAGDLDALYQPHPANVARA